MSAAAVRRSFTVAASAVSRRGGAIARGPGGTVSATASPVSATSMPVSIATRGLLTRAADVSLSPVRRHSLTPQPVGPAVWTSSQLGSAGWAVLAPQPAASASVRSGFHSTSLAAKGSDDEAEKRVVNLGSVGGSNPWLRIRVKRDDDFFDSDSDSSDGGWRERRRRKKLGKHFGGLGKKDNVEVNIPLNLVTWGVKMGKSMGLKDLEGVDIKELERIINGMDEESLRNMGMSGGSLINVKADGHLIDVSIVNADSAKRT